MKPSPARIVSRIANPIDTDWVKRVKKTWLNESKPPPTMSDDRDCLDHLEKVIGWVDGLAEDLLFDKGFYYLPDAWTSKSIPRRIKKKVVDELVAVRARLVEGVDWIKHTAAGMDPEGRTYKMDGGRIFKFYEERDPRSPLRAFYADSRQITEEALAEASAIFTRKFIRALNTAINKYGQTAPIDFGEVGPFKFSVGDMNVVYLDLPRSFTGPLGTVPTREQVEEGNVRRPNMREYAKLLTKAKALMERRGLGYLWYGPLLIKCRECGGENPYGAHFGVGAHYHPRADSISLYLDPKASVPRLLAHELGHRYYYRFMDKADRSKFDSYFGVVPATSDYGGAVSSEDFAEVFAAYVMGDDLSRDQVERFKAFLGRTRRTSSQRVAHRFIRAELG